MHTSTYYVDPAVSAPLMVTQSPIANGQTNSHDPTLPPFGMRVRLKANVDISAYPAEVQVVLTALKKYGMILADGGGSNWVVGGVMDDRWLTTQMDTINNGGITGKDFEVIQMGPLKTHYAGS